MNLAPIIFAVVLAMPPLPPSVPRPAHDTSQGAAAKQLIKPKLVVLPPNAKLVWDAATNATSYNVYVRLITNGPPQAPRYTWSRLTNTTFTTYPFQIDKTRTGLMLYSVTASNSFGESGFVPLKLVPYNWVSKP